MSEKITLAKIATACRLSVGTVSRALNQKADISAETREYVLQVAQELGYKKGSQEAESPLRIGVVSCTERSDFYREVTLGMEKARAEFGEQQVLLDYQLTEFLHQEEQLALLSALDTSAYDALLVNSAGAKTGQYIRQRFLEGLPVATFNTDAPDSERLFFAGCNAHTTGQVGAHFLGKLLNGRGKVLLFGSLLGRPAWMDRFSGAYAVFHQDFPEIEICPVFHELSSQEEITKKALYYLQNTPDIAGILPINCTCTCSILTALGTLGRTDIRLVGFDLTSETRQGLLDDFCDALLFQDPFLQGYLAVKSMAQYLTAKTLPSQRELVLSPQLIMKYNLPEA